MAVSADALLRAAQQLSLAELDRLADGLAVLRARRAIETNPQSEAELIRQIREAVPPVLLHRAATLRRKRRAGKLTPEEHDELVRLTDLIEQLTARRVLHLAQLAQQRGVTLEQAMADLGLRAPAVE